MDADGRGGLQHEGKESEGSNLIASLVNEVTDYAILTLDLEGRVASWNAGAERIKGYAADEIIGRHFGIFYPETESAAGLPEQLLSAARAVGRVEHEGWRVRQDGTRFWANVVITALRGGDGVLRGYGKVTRDLTERYEAEQDLRSSEERFRVAFEHAATPVSTVSLEPEDFGSLLSVNPAYGELVGRTVDQLTGTRVGDLILAEDMSTGVDIPLGRLADGETDRIQFERRYLRSDGQVVSTLVTDALYVNADGRRMAIGQIVDISERKRFEQQLQHLADHDALTGLFNRRRFEAELERALMHTRRSGDTTAVMSMDLDGFKFVNDSMGHAAGDQLVTRLADVARRALSETDVIARTGGDEFAMILANADIPKAESVARNLLESIRRVGATALGGDRQVTASVGITTYMPGDELEAGDLMVEADMAMYSAKHEGKNRHAVYRRGQQDRERVVARPEWRAGLTEAVAREHWVLLAQPIVPICSTSVPWYEVLLRMPEHAQQLMEPSALLRNAERLGLIEQMDDWALARVVELLHDQTVAGNDIGLSVNISAGTLNAGRISQSLESLLQQFPVRHGRLTIEITEAAVITNIDQARELADDIHRLGCRLAVDDFSAGLSSFQHLEHLGFDYIKLGGEFIRHLPDSRSDQLVVHAVADIARGLGSDTIADCVHDHRISAWLHTLGVGFGQGDHLGRPGPILEQLSAPPDVTACAPGQAGERPLTA
jgi:diguanylate cyclase (GGDEF)-like protein/PAS domain S-box-containing protein